jgi:ATP-dependent DNA helicase PIF1
MGQGKKSKKSPGDPAVSVEALNRAAAQEGSRNRAQATGKPVREAISVSEEYLKVQALLEAGSRVVFVTGNAGTGKSTLIRHLRRVLDKEIVVLAPTGVAALNVGGMTVHSFFHLPPRIQDPKDIRVPADCRLYEQVDLLVVDEVSMLRCDLIDAMDAFLREARSDQSAFGGVQLLLVGDLFQLPPVVPRAEAEVLAARGYATPYFFSACALQDIPLVPVELTSVHRQEDPGFVALLNRVRVAERTLETVSELNRLCGSGSEADGAITLTATNAVADHINEEELLRISSKEHLMEGELEGRFNFNRDRLPSPLDLRLKVGARVMFTKNDEQKRWVNGTMGIVLAIDEGSIRVEVNGKNHDVEQTSWETYEYKFDAKQDCILSEPQGRYTQYPLMLAWAVTIHKSQGKTLDNVLIDLGHGAFASGQVYVALSRCRSIEGIKLAQPLRPSDIRCDPTIRLFYLALAEQAD